MKTLYHSLLLALALAGTAYGQQPPDVVNSDGNNNTAMGSYALLSLSGGNGYNTAAGMDAMGLNTTGDYNSAFGSIALYQNTTGSGNSAFGSSALRNSQTARENSAFGANALYLNTTGCCNTASGYGALRNNTDGAASAAVGDSALYLNTTGSNNTASGVAALFSNSTGSNNIAVGYQAGHYLTTGSNNIDIGNAGVAGESNFIRIGTKGTQKGAIIAGINTSTVTGSAVYVTNTGRLGVLASSERYKTAIAPIGDGTDKLPQLRPVSFHLKSDPKGAIQYGLIAEEVAKVYPELVIRGDKGRIEGVRYDELAPMLLNEVQKQRAQMTARIDAQAAELHDLKQQMLELKALHANR